jgi:glycosyltransferase involved in cell wall biosynthesis
VVTARPAVAAATSVVIAAHTPERAGDLSCAVSSAQSQQPPPHQVVVAVDNHADLCEWARTQLHGVTVVHHRGPRGASATRNAGARAADGDFLAFLDDDAVARPSWLQRLVAPLGRPDVIGAGGRVEPVWPGLEPQWMPEEFLWVVGASYRGLPETAGPIRNVWSENMAVARSDFWAVGGFREDFGKTDHVSSPEDTDFCIRLANALDRGTWWYEPSALVGHKVPPGRCTVRFFLWRCRNEGQGKAELSAWLGTGEGLRDERQHAIKTLPAGIGRELRTAMADRELAAALRASAIGIGLSAASLGYVGRRARLWAAPRLAPAG